MKYTPLLLSMISVFIGIRFRSNPNRTVCIICLHLSSSFISGAAARLKFSPLLLDISTDSLRKLPSWNIPYIRQSISKINANKRYRITTHKHYQVMKSSSIPQFGRPRITKQMHFRWVRYPMQLVLDIFYRSIPTNILYSIFHKLFLFPPNNNLNKHEQSELTKG